eukprot:7207941-Karenia_brevis.AAC.1
MVSRKKKKQGDVVPAAEELWQLLSQCGVLADSSLEWGQLLGHGFERYRVRLLEAYRESSDRDINARLSAFYKWQQFARGQESDELRM